MTSSKFTQPWRQSSVQLEARLAKIQPHSCISTTGETLVLILNFNSLNSTLWHGISSPEFVIKRENLFKTLREYYGLSKRIAICLTFPPPHLPNKDVKTRQRDFLNRLVPVIDGFPELQKVHILFQTREVRWDQILILAPFYGMTFTAWTCAIEEHRKKPISLIHAGHGFNRRLATFYRQMQDRKELAWQYPLGMPEVGPWPKGKLYEW